MRWNRGLALVACAGLMGCVGPGKDAPRMMQPAYGATTPAGYPQDYPQPDPQNVPQVSGPQPAPLSASEMDAGPPLSSGPSGTSDRDANRYDEVGYATWYGEELGGQRTASGAVYDPKGFTAAHRTLPLGSYAEITSLDTGRTIVVLVNDRGPRQTNLLIDLSQGAAQALGIKSRGAVRVRRIVAGPSDLAAFRAGQPGAPRMDAPPGLVAALRQRMGAPAPQPLPSRRPIPRATPEPQVASPPRTAPPPGRPAPVANNGFYVQVAAFASQPRAAALAKSLGGQAVSAGSVWRVRLGPYANADQAERARDAAAARGYADARVVRQD